MDECPLFWHTDAMLEPLQLRLLFAAAIGAKAIAAATAAPAVASEAMNLALMGGSFPDPDIGILTGGEELAPDCLMFSAYGGGTGKSRAS